MRGKRTGEGTALGVVLFALAALASACVVTTTPPLQRGILVSGPPPAIVREERPPSPAAQASWIAGYWHWTGIQYAWITGHWEAAPPLGTIWRAPLYVQNNGAYFYEPGGWAPTVARPTAPPPSAEAFR